MNTVNELTVYIIIAGGRDFDDYDTLITECDFMLSRLSKTHRIIIVSGGARGADTLALNYANDRGYDVQIMLADWDAHGKSAGYIRNAEMAAVATHCFAFWDHQSKGTKHMIDTARKLNLPVHVVKY